MRLLQNVFDMSRQFKTIGDAVPHIVSEMHESEAELTAPFFTAAETAQLMRLMRIAQENLCCAEMGSDAEKKAAREILDLEAKMAEWEKL